MGSITLIRYKKVVSVVLIFLTAGLIFDATAIVLMIIGANGTPFTVHGFIGYTAFALMLIDIIWVWITYFKNGIDSGIHKNLQNYKNHVF